MQTELLCTTSSGQPHTHCQLPRSSTLYPQTMADRSINRDGGLEDGLVFHPLMSTRQAKRPVGRTVQMYLDVLSNITDFYLNNNLTESVCTIDSSPHASDGFKTDSASFLPNSFFFCCCNLFMRMLLEIKLYDACFFSDSLFSGSCNYCRFGGSIIVETLPIRNLSSSLNSLASIIQRVDK